MTELENWLHSKNFLLVFGCYHHVHFYKQKYVHLIIVVFKLNHVKEFEI